MSLSIRYYYVITSLSAHIVPWNANYARCQHSIAHSFLLKQRDTFRFRLFVYSKGRIREQNTNMAGCDVWEWGFESQPLDGCVVAVQVSMFVINGHEHRETLSVEAACLVPKIMKCPLTELWGHLNKSVKTANIFNNIKPLFRSIKWY
jgi:hypothetical protein